MDTELMLDVGQANELKLAFRRHGWSNAEINKLCEGNLLAHLLPLVREYGNITAVVKYLINCDADPFIPNGWRVEEADQLVSRVRSVFEWDESKVLLHLSSNQMDGKSIKGEQLQTELANESVLNANVLDYLLAYQTLIPDEWKGKCVFFWGTVYRDLRGRLCVRFLYFDDGEWRSLCLWLGGVWYGDHPVAVRAS